MMKLTDYLAAELAERGVRNAFALTGGAVVHILDSLAREGRIDVVFHHHEQAAAFAAGAASKVTNQVAVCAVTTGPGVTNTITGLAGAWLDSVPCLFISGQARLGHTTLGKKVRQIGTQQLDVIPLVSPMTKYAVMVTKAEDIRYELEKALYLATTGRPGPVWIDIPLDLQWVNIEPETLRPFVPPSTSPPSIDGKAQEVVNLLQNSSRPLLVLGAGVWRSGARDLVMTLQEQLSLPVVASWGAVDVIPHNDPLFLGCPGLAGQRGANIAVANADLLVVLGSHLCIPMTGTRLEQFGRHAKIVMVDIDADEMEERAIPISLPIQSDVSHFLTELSRHNPQPQPAWEEWRSLASEYRALNSPPPPEREIISPYELVHHVSEATREGDQVVVDGGGTNVYVSYQTSRVKSGQRMILSTALCSMGSGMPEAIGVSRALGGARTIVFCGDGSFQLNIQELQTLRHHNLPIKVFVSNNQGYLSIRQTQGGFLGGNYLGSSSSGGLTLPDYGKVVEGFGVRYFRVDRREDLRATIEEALRHNGPTVCEVATDPEQELIPRQGFEKQPDGSFAPRPLEDMAPFLDRELFRRLMVSER